jgi:hypothetical protein
MCLLCLHRCVRPPASLCRCAIPLCAGFRRSAFGPADGKETDTRSRRGLHAIQHRGCTGRRATIAAFRTVADSCSPDLISPLARSLWFPRRHPPRHKHATTHDEPVVSTDPPPLLGRVCACRGPARSDPSVRLSCPCLAPGPSFLCVRPFRSVPSLSGLVESLGGNIQCVVLCCSFAQLRAVRPFTSASGFSLLVRGG